MSDIADVLNRLNELGRDDLAEVVTCLMGERDNLAVRLSESEAGELKNALAVGQAVLELSEERKENDALRAQLSEAQAGLAEIGKQKPVAWIHHDRQLNWASIEPEQPGHGYTPVYANPVTPTCAAPAAQAVPNVIRDAKELKEGFYYLVRQRDSTAFDFVAQVRNGLLTTSWLEVRPEDFTAYREAIEIQLPTWPDSPAKADVQEIFPGTSEALNNISVFPSRGQ